ncbi:hypothetical protein N665_0726s0016 [Sinapis alba]|nr:hypothetical protein N665_0726s0016 [Sinapis alba]
MLSKQHLLLCIAPIPFDVLEGIHMLLRSYTLHGYHYLVMHRASAMYFSRMYQQPPLKKVEQKKHRAKSEFHGLNAIEIIRFNYKSDGASFLCFSLYMFPCLKELNLINLNIEVIPDDVSALQLLEKLDWSGNGFETLPKTMNQLPRLKHVSLCNCRRLKALPELVGLETIKLSGCMSLQSLLETSHVESGLGSYQLLELCIDGYITVKCQRKKLRSVEGVPLSLKYLYAHGCESLETVSLPLDHSIKHLDPSHCFCLSRDEHLITQFLNEGQTKKHSELIESMLHLKNEDTELLSSRLMLLHWDVFPLTALPCRFYPQSLVEDIIRDSNLTSFWKGTMFSPFSYNWSWEVDRIFRLELRLYFFHFQDESSFHHLVIFRATKTIGEEMDNRGVQDQPGKEDFSAPFFLLSESAPAHSASVCGTNSLG